MAVKFSCKNVASLSLFSLFWILFFLSLLSQTMMSHKRAGERKWASLFLNTTSTCSRTMSYLTAIIIWWKWRKQKCGSFTWTRTFLGAKKKEKKGKHRKGKADGNDKSEKSDTNPVGQDGNILKCFRCDSTRHVALKYLHWAN